MAQDHYVPTLRESRIDAQKIYSQPWYKERVRTKYIKSLQPTDTARFLNGKNWQFLKDGLDDFRDGLPPNIDDDDIVIKGPTAMTPNFRGGTASTNSVKQPATRKRFNKYQVCYAKVTPLQQSKRDHIDEIEYGLTQHPLALYPHLEEGIPPEVFEEVVDILDPEMNLEDSQTDEDSYENQSEYEYEDIPAPPIRPDSVISGKDGSEEFRVRNPYRWLPRREDKEKRDKRNAQEKRSMSPSQDEHIKTVTKDFCDWVASLGGESNNIEESTITSLFASGYETKPALSVPIHVVELTNVPPELRMSASVPPQPTTTQTADQLPHAPRRQKNWTYSGGYEPSWAKFIFGAWYLEPESWKKRGAQEPLIDPQELKDQEMSDAKKESTALDADLAPMHGANAFKEFIDRKTVRRPEFLNRVAEIQDRVAKEELANLEAEKNNLKRSSSKTKT